MEGPKAYSTSSDRVQSSGVFRARHLPDVPEDDDFVMEHLNDPNYDLRKRPSTTYSDSHAPSDTISADIKSKKYDHSDADAESQYGSDRDSTERPESAFDFDKYVDPLLGIFISPVSLHILKSAPWSLAWMIRLCM